MDRINQQRGSDDSERSVLKYHGKARPQVIASLIATFGTFCSGSVLAWTSTANPQLKKGTEIGEVSDSDLSLIASIAVVGALISGFAAGYSIDKIGRKLTMILLVIPFVLGWVLVAFAQNLGMMIAGRLVTGFCAGAYTLAVPVYIAEITQDKFRGMMSNCMVVALVSGILFSYTVGAVVTWMLLSIISGTLPLLLAVMLFFIPDSPRYQLGKHMRPDAQESLRWLRGMDSVSDIEDELKEIEHSIRHTEAECGGSALQNLNKRTMKPVAICLMLMVFQQFGGINAVIFFTVDIFQSSGSDIDPNIASIIIGSIQVISVVVSTALISRVGRKPLMFISETGMAISLAALGAFFYMKDRNNGETPENMGWLPLVSMMLYIVTYNLGCASLPWTFMGELCPPQIKGFASALVTSTCWALAFIVTYTFADLLKLLGSHFVFWIFGLFCVGGAIFTVIVLPETKGKSLDEIQKIFK